MFARVKRIALSLMACTLFIPVAYTAVSARQSHSTNLRNHIKYGTNIDARENWWGQQEGPLPSQVNSNVPVDYDDWLTQAPQP